MDGQKDSAYANIILGDVPSAPTTSVYQVNNAWTSLSKLVVGFDQLPAESSNGLTILSYSLEIDYNLSGDFVPLTGNIVDQLGLTYTVPGLSRSQTYAFRYRAKN